MARYKKMLSEPTLNKEEETFCHCVHDGMKPTEAYRVAYNKPFEKGHLAHQRSTALMEREDIAARIAEIREAFSHKFEINRDFISQNLLHSLVIAKRNGSSSEIRKSAMDLGKLHGLVVEKTELNANHQFQVMKAVEINGSALTFDIGTGKVIEPGEAHISQAEPREVGYSEGQDEDEEASTEAHTQPDLTGEELL